MPQKLLLALRLQFGVLGIVAFFAATSANEPAVGVQNATGVAKVAEPAG